MDIRKITITNEQYEKLENDLQKTIRESLRRDLLLDDFEYEHAGIGRGLSMGICGRVSNYLANSLNVELNKMFNESTSSLISHTIVLQAFVAFVETLHTSGRWNALYKNRSKLVDTMGTYVENLLGIREPRSPTLLGNFINVID